MRRGRGQRHPPGRAKGKGKGNRKGKNNSYTDDGPAPRDPKGKGEGKRCGQVELFSYTEEQLRRPYFVRARSPSAKHGTVGANTPPPRSKSWQPGTRPNPGIPIIPTGKVMGSQAASSNELAGTTSKANAAAASSVANDDNRD